MSITCEQRSLEDAWADDELTKVNQWPPQRVREREEEWSQLSDPDPIGHRLHRRTLAFAALAAMTACATMWADSTLGLSRGQRIVSVLGCALFVTFAGAAVRLMARHATWPLVARAGEAGAYLVRMVLTAVGYLFVVLAALLLLKVSVGQLLVSGAITGVGVGIAAQQSLGNMAAGIMIIATSPFRVGDRITLRSGPLGGQYDGTITDVSLTFTTMRTIEGPITFPNSAVLGAATGRRPTPAGDF